MKPTLMPKTIQQNLPFLIAIACVAMFVEQAYAIVNFSTLPLYIDKAMKLSHFVGLIGATVLFSQAVLNGPMGMLSDRLGRRKLLVAGPLCSVLSCIGTVALHGQGGVAGAVAMIALRVLDGAGAAMLWPALYATIGDKVSAKEQAGAMSILNATYMIGLALGPFVGGELNVRLGGTHPDTSALRYAPSFWAAAALFAIAAIIAFVVAPSRAQERHEIEKHEQKLSKEEGHADGHADGHGGSAASLEDIKIALRRVPMLLLLGFLIFLAVGVIAPNVKLYTYDVLHMGEDAFGRLMLVPALIIAALAVPIGRMGDKWGKARSVQIGLGLCVLSLWSIILVPQQWALVTMGILIGIGYILAFSSYMAHVSEVAGSQARASVSGAVLTAQGVGMGVGYAGLASPLYQANHILPFYVAAGLLTLGLVLSFVALKKSTKTGESV
jgi:MFS transporter, DHA1 family, multidrug resistance protein